MEKRIANNVFFDDDTLHKAYLPKWPALVVAGKKVTEEQAAEILIRTDSHMPDFSYAGNDQHHARRVSALFGMSIGRTFDLSDDERQDYWSRQDSLRKRMNILDIYYLHNDRIISAWVGGPHGWCSWGGDIFCNNYNIGKWPTVDEIAEEWGKIAQAFPFLDLRAHLYDDEVGHDGQPAVEYVVSQGVVVVTHPREMISPPVGVDYESLPFRIFGDHSFEHGIGVETLKWKLEKVYGEVPQL